MIQELIRKGGDITNYRENTSTKSPGVLFLLLGLPGNKYDL